MITTQECRYFVWDDKQLFRITEDGEEQERWEAETDSWLPCGDFVLVHWLVMPDPVFVEVSGPEDFSGYGSEVVLTESTFESYQALIALAREMLEATY